MILYKQKILFELIYWKPVQLLISYGLNNLQQIDALTVL